MLTPDEISQRRFLVSLRGYDRDEVTEFLGEVASEVRTLRARAAELEAQTQRVGASGVPADSRAALQSLGEETTRILVAAEESARSIETRATAHAREAIEAAEREARETTERASRQAARTIAEAERRRDEVAAEIAQLHQERDEFVSALRASMTTVAGVAGGLEHDPATPVVARDGAAGSHAAGTSPVVLAEELADVVTPTEDQAAAQPATDGAADDGAADAPVVDEADDDGDEDEDADEGEPAEPIPDVEPEPVRPVDQDESGGQVPGTDASGPAATATIVDAEEGTLGTVALLRDATLESIRDDMQRQCKRGLQEVHNEVLVAIRDHGRDAELVDLLPAETDLDDLGNLGTDHLAAAYRGALDDAASAVGGDTPADLADGARVHAAAATFRAVLSHEVTAALRATLRAGLEATEAEPQLSERVSEVFRDLRGPVLDAVVEENLQRTYGHGLLDAWDQLDVGQVRWEPGPETRCPENRCHANADEGPVAIGHDFPSGDRVPPAHPGCTCVVVPA